MTSMHPQIQLLLQCIDREEEEQAVRYRLDQQHTLKQLKAEGLALHPLTVTRRGFGWADYPEISFRLPFPPETQLFRDGAAIECFCAGEEPVKGTLLQLEGQSGQFRLHAPDFPEWIEDAGMGIKLTPDTRTTSIMKTVIRGLENNPTLLRLFRHWHEPAATPKTTAQPDAPPADAGSQTLNASQQRAVAAIMQEETVTILHGPPGTGKTTTLAEAIDRLVQQGEKILVTAPSNTAVDHLCKQLLRRGIQLLRTGNTGKVDEAIFPHTPEGKMQHSKALKEIKDLKIRAAEFRKLALKYKRQFGKAEREQRNLLFREVRAIRDEIRKLEDYHQEKLLREAAVIAGTPIGLYDAKLGDIRFDRLVVDEAGQCLEPLAWCVIPLADKLVLAGDPFQLPPTVLSIEAARKGFNRSILEIAMTQTERVFLLDTQYRMRTSIAGFSNEYFYQGKLQSAPHLADKQVHLTFIDTAGSGFAEERGPDGVSLQNPGELSVAAHLLQTADYLPADTAFISPYSGQVSAARDTLPAAVRVSTIDSFQGQEYRNVIVSLVRSNDDGDLGFLKDYRRMNVALTRAMESLVVIADSATIGTDPFFAAFLAYAEKVGAYRSVWEFELF